MVVTEHLQHTGCHWSVIRLLMIGISEVYHQIQNSWSTIKLYLAILFIPALSTVWGRQDCNGPFYKSPDNCCIASWSNGQGFKATDIARLRMVKNINFFWDSKKLFLTYWKTVFWVTEHFCIKWTFWKNVFFCPKNAFFLTKMACWPSPERAGAAMSRNFFLGRILLLKSWRI